MAEVKPENSGNQTSGKASPASKDPKADKVEAGKAKKIPDDVFIEKSLKVQRVGWLVIWGVFIIQPFFTWHYVGWVSALISPIALMVFVRGIINFNKPPKDESSESSADGDKDKKSEDGKDGDKKEGDEEKKDEGEEDKK